MSAAVGRGDSEKLVCLGQAKRAHGLRGEVVIESFTEPPENFGKYGVLYDEGGERFAPLAIRPLKRGLGVRFEDIDTREKAEGLVHKYFYLPRESLPSAEKGCWYYEDLVGLSVLCPDKKPFGAIGAVYNFGAGEVLEIEGEYIPLGGGFIASVHMSEGYVMLSPEAVTWLTRNDARNQGGKK